MREKGVGTPGDPSFPNWHEFPADASPRCACLKRHEFNGLAERLAWRLPARRDAGVAPEALFMWQTRVLEAVF